VEEFQRASFTLRTAETLHGEVEEIYEFVTRRACEIFLRRPDTTLSIEDWLTAERKVLWKPELRVRERKNRVVVEVPVPPKTAEKIEILFTSDQLLLRTVGEDAAKRAFRTVRLPNRIDVRKVTARYTSGHVIVIAAPILEHSRRNTLFTS
jgi:HSP20 family molecular chaperone IbpA